VVDVLDMGQADDGALFMVLELLRGADLATLRRSGGPLPPRDAVELVSPVIDALASAHAAGIVHRDIKPSNVYLARQADGTMLPKLLDFGIAKAVGDTEIGGTKSGVIVGTPHYMSPEQAEGAAEVGPASDVWSVGVMLYELVSGSLPYDAGSPTAILVTILQKPHVPLVDVAPSVPPALAAAIERALAREPEARPSDLRAWVGELRAAVGLAPMTMPLVSAVTLPAALAESALSLAHFPTDPPPAPALPSRPRARSSAPAWIAIGATMLVLSTALGLAIAWHASRAEPVARALPMPEATPPPPSAPPPSVAAPATTTTPPPPAETTVEPEQATAPRPPRTTTRPARVPSGDGAHGRRPIATITTTW
jgi:serine/threonine-protein kinase